MLMHYEDATKVKVSKQTYDFKVKHWLGSGLPTARLKRRQLHVAFCCKKQLRQVMGRFEVSARQQAPNNDSEARALELVSILVIAIYIY